MPPKNLLDKQTGFTMVELIVIMIIVGIMAVTVLPRMDLLSGFDSRGMRDQTIAAMRFAQKSALAQRRHVCVAIVDSDITLRVASAFATTATCTAATSLDQELAYPADNCGSGNASTVCPPSRVTTTIGGGYILFDPSGRPISGAGSYAVSGESPILVEAETGYVH